MTDIRLIFTSGCSAQINFPAVRRCRPDKASKVDLHIYRDGAIGQEFADMVVSNKPAGGIVKS